LRRETPRIVARTHTEAPHKVLSHHIRAAISAAARNLVQLHAPCSIIRPRKPNRCGCNRTALVGRHRRAQATGNRHVHDFDHPNVCDLIDAAPFDS
jgi:hypothetical protein